MDFTTRLIFSVFPGAIGLGYFIYGKRQAEIIPMLAGIGLCVFSYFTSNLILSILLAAALIIIPWLIRFSPIKERNDTGRRS